MTSQPEEKRAFADLSPREKLVFVLKVALCIISFGFIYPNIMHD